MPLDVRERCSNCHELKARSEFPNTVTGRVNKKRVKRVFSPVCSACLEANPKLRTLVGTYVREQASRS